jgi:hypothetical protein
MLEENRRRRHCGCFHVFGPKKEALRGRRFSSYEEFIDAMQNWIRSNQNLIFYDGIKKTSETLEPIS